MSHNQLSIGIAGLGRHAMRVHLPTVNNSPYFSLSAVASKYQQNISSGILSTGEVKCYPDYLTMIKSTNIDAVIISTSNNLHGPLTIEALTHGKHVLCEKPLSWKNEEIEEISKLLCNKKLILACGFMYRHHPLYNFIKEEVSNTDPHEIIARFHYPPLEDTAIRSRKDLGGGALLDIGCYILDVAEFLLPDAPSQIEYRHEINNKTLCDISGQISIANGKNKLYGSFSQSQPRNQQLQVWSEHVGIESSSPFLIPRTKQVTAVKTLADGTRTTQTFPACNLYQAQIDLFGESIFAGRILPPLTSGINNAKSLASLHNMIQN
jgi:D-xylose 1-dehydrogenase (NADP+, D-xylono-1,5-lactone-forming)